MSSILDQVLAQTGTSSNLDNLTIKVGKSVQRIASEVDAAMQPQITVGEGFTPNNTVGYGDAYYENIKEATYLDAKAAEYEKRKAEDSERFLSEENLTSANPFMWGASNIANFGANVAGTVVNTFENISAAGAAAQRESLNSAIPEDIRNIEERRRLAQFPGATRYKLHKLDERFNAGLDSAELAEANEERAQLLKQLDMVYPSEQELARLKANSGLNGMGTWEDVFKERDRYDRVNKELRGDPKNGVASFTGASEWGNNKSLANLKERVADEDGGKFKETINDPESSFMDKAGAWGTRIGSYLGHATTNPGAVPEMLAESLPYMVPVTAPVAAAGAGSEIYARGTQEYREKYGRDTIPTADHAAIGALGAAMAGSTFVQGGLERRMLQGGFAQGSGRMVDSVAGAVRNKVNQASAATIAKTPYAGGILDAAVRGTTAVTAKSAAPIARVGVAATAEGLQEGFQNSIEQNAGLQATIDQSQLSEAVALGGLMGGAISAPGVAVQAGADAFRGSQQRKQEELVGAADTTEDDLINPSSTKYNPTQAINREILKATSTKEEMAPEAITESKAKVDTYYAATKEAYDRSTQALEDAKGLGALEQMYEEKKVSYASQLENLAKRLPERYDEAKNAFDKMLNSFEVRIAAAKENQDKISDLEGRNKEDKEFYDNATKSYKQFDDWYKTKTANEQTAPANTTEEATQLLGAPGFGEVTRMQELAADESVPQDVRNRLRVVSEALIAENKAKNLGQVNKDINKGSEKYRGMSEYITEMQQAVQSGDSAQQRILSRDLSNFESTMSSKLDALKAAQEAADQAKKQIRIVRNEDGSWFADTEGKVSRKQFSKNNGFTVNPHRADGTKGADVTRNAMEVNLEAIRATKLALDEILNSSKAPRQQAAQVDPEVAFQQLMDDMNADERTNGRDTTARDTDPGVRTVDSFGARPTPPNIAPNADGVWGAVENNEGDLNDNTGPNPTTGNPFGNLGLEDPFENVQGTDQEFQPEYGFDNESENPAPVSQPESQVSSAQQSEEQSDNGVDLTGTELQAFNIITQFVTDPDADIPKIADTVSFRGNGVRLSEDNMVRWFSVDPSMAADSLRALDQEGLVRREVTSNSWQINGKPSVSYESVWGNPKDSAEVTTDTVIEDDIQDEQAINARKYPASKGWKRTELTKSIKYSKDNGDGTETILNTDKVTGDVVREPVTRNKAVQEAKNEIIKENRNAQAKTYEDSTQLTETSDNELTGQEDAETAFQDEVSNIEVTDVDTKTLADGSVDESPAGALDALDTNGLSYKEAIAAEKEKPLDQQNLVKTGFVQRVIDGVNSPLVLVKDFFSYVAGLTSNFNENGKFTRSSAKALAADMYRASTGKQASDYEAEVAAKLFYRLGQDVPMVQNLVNGKTPERMKFAHESFIDYVMKDGVLEENVATAIVAASLDWVGQNATEDAAEVRTISKMLGLKDIKYLPNKVQTRLAHVGQYRPHVTEQLGKSIMASLQLKQLAEVDEARRDKLGQALGTAALNYMLQKGMVEMSTFKHSVLGDMKAQVLEYTNGKEDTRDNKFGNPNGTSDFISAALIQNDNGDVSLSNEAKNVVRDFGNDVIKDMFNTERAYKDVSIDPIEVTPQTFNGFGSRVSKFQAGVVAKQQATAYELDKGMSAILKAFTTSPERRSTLVKLLGAVDPSTKLSIRKKSVESINDGIARSLSIIERTMETTKGKPFYLPHTVWSNMRMGIDSAFNPQGDKIHRAFSSLSEERAEIDLNSMSIFTAKNDGSTTSYGNFLRALAFRMDGVKVPGVVNGKGLDKNTNADFLPKLDEYIHSQPVEDAANALGRIMNGKEGKGDIKLVQDLIAEWGDGDVGQSALTLSALNAIREMHKAERSQSKKFITSVTPESDGTNNGPAFTHMMMNTLTTGMAKAFGIFRNNPNNIRNLAQYRTIENGKDMYEMLGEVKELFWAQADVHPDLRVAFDGLDSKFAGRNGAKRDLIPFNYGAGYKAIVKANGREFLEGIYDSLESAINDNSPQKMSETVGHINTILKFYNQNHKGKVPLLNAAAFKDMDLKLPDQVEQAIRSVDTAVRGPVIKDALKEQLSDYIQARDEFNLASNAAFNLYEPLYKSMASQYLADIKENDKVRASMDEGISKQERTEIMNGIKKYMPTLQVAMGKQSSNGKTSGIPLIDVSRVWNEKRGVQVPFKQEVKALNRSFKYMFSPISNNQFFEPGVAGLALFIQSHDAYVTARVMEALTVQNQHDSNSTNAHDLEVMAKIQNEAYLDAVSMSHIGQSFVQAVLAPMQAYADGLVSGNTDQRTQVHAALSSLSKSVGLSDGTDPVNGRENIGQVLEHLVRHMYGKDLGKMENLLNTYSINQYGTEGGEYLITKGKKNTLESRKQGLEAAMELDLKKVANLAKGLDKFLSSKDETKVNTDGTGSNKFDAESEAAQEVEEIRQETTKEQKPNTFSQDLLKYRNELKDPKRLVKFVQHNLGKYLKDERPQVAANAKMYNELLQLAMGSLDGLEVNIVTKGEDTSHMLGVDEANAGNVNAWFKAVGDKKQINIRLDSGLKVDAKVVVHELMHAATGIALKNLRDMKASGKVAPKYKDAMKSYERLEKLYQHVRDNVTGTDVYIENYGISSLDEFIATGLTYPEFMKKLSTISAPADLDYRLPKAGSLFRDMIDNLMGVFYGFFAPGKKYSAKELTAYEALVIDTAQFVQRTQDVPALRSLPSLTELLGAPQERAHTQVSQMTSSEVFDVLPETGDASFDAHLKGVMKSVTDRAFGSLPTSYDGTEYSPEQIWNNALQSGEKPYVTDALVNGFGMTSREQFAVEAIELALEESLKDKSLSASYRELGVAFDSAKKNLKVEDFTKGDWEYMDQQEKAEAQQKYDYLFDTANPNYLSRFMAMALGNKEVHALLNMEVDRKARVPEVNNEWFNKAAALLDTAFDVLTDKHLGPGASKRTNNRIGLIAKKFIDIDHKNRNKALEKIEEAMEKVDNVANNVVISAGHKLSDLASATNPESQIGKIVRNTTIQTFSGKPLAVFDVVQDWRNQENQNTTLGFGGELLKEIGNVTENGKVVESLLRQTKLHENNAQRLRTEIKKDVLELFKDEGKNLTKEQREAITYGVLRTDLQALSTKYSMNDVARYIQSHGARKSEIRLLERGLSPVHIQRAKDLARYMQTGKGNEILVKNAFGIAADAGLANPNMNPDPALVERIDHLVSLYSLEYMNSDMRKELAKVVEDERENGGLENLLKYHKGLVNDSKATLFKGDPLNVTKGYLPEVTNSYRDVTVAYTQADADRLRSAMYIEVGPVSRSQSDPSEFTPIMFYTEDAGKQQFISGAIALYNNGSKGRDVDMDTVELANAINAGRSSLVNDPKYNPFDSVDGMIPKYDTKGNITGYRYEMAAGTRDKYLERNNDFSDLIGTFTSLGYTKLANRTQNKKIVNALHDIYKNSTAWDRKKFVYVSYESTDPVAYAAWDRLSHDTKEDVKKTWGKYGMWVSNETFLTVFGYPKESLFTRAFDKTDGYRGIGEELYVTMMRGLFKDNSRIYAAKTERMWQEMVALTKNFIVIRNVTTLFMNVAANTFLLSAHGVPIGDIIQHTKDSILGGIQHRKDLSMITKLEGRQRSGIGDPVQLQNEINIIRNRMQQNPMHEFISAGMFSGIVEDIDPSANMYSYQSSLQRKFEGKYEKLPKMLRTGIEYAFVTPSTPLYQFLHSSTQYSDFSAKYVLYKYYTEKAPKKLSHEAAIQEASNNFINYDVPTSPWMQYANDMGILMFTKYNLRIQKAMFKLVAERPASALSQAFLMNQFSTMPPGIDPIVFNQIGMPFRDGAFGLFGVLDEPFPLKLLQ